VGGFDDSAVALSTHLPLTTIRQPQERVTEETVRLLLALIDGAEHLDPVILPTDLIVHEST
jgi:DNA-binding LacI/PurR family transcriptional regulator